MGGGFRERIKNMIKICANCYNVFDANRNNRKYCSKKCAEQAYRRIQARISSGKRKNTEKICLTCHKAFMAQSESVLECPKCRHRTYHRTCRTCKTKFDTKNRDRIHCYECVPGKSLTQLCWDCAKATDANKCSWVRNYKYPKGCKRKEGYIVSCPGFEAE